MNATATLNPPPTLPDLPERIRARLDTFARPALEAAAALAGIRARLGRRYVAEAWSAQRPRLVAAYAAADAALSSIPDPDRQAAARAYLVAQLPAGFVEPDEAAYFGADSAPDLPRPWEGAPVEAGEPAATPEDY